MTMSRSLLLLAAITAVASGVTIKLGSYSNSDCFGAPSEEAVYGSSCSTITQSQGAMTISVSTRSKGGSCFGDTPSMESYLGESCSGNLMDTSPFSALLAKWLATSHAGGGSHAAAINPAGVGGYHGEGCTSDTDREKSARTGFRSSDVSCNLNGACHKASGACACNKSYKGRTCNVIDMAVECTTRATCTCKYAIDAVCNNDVAASPAATASVNNCADLKAKVPGVSCTDDGFIGTCDANPDEPGTFIRLSCTSPAFFPRPTAWVALVTLLAVAFVC
jgi:hypothetical protein